MAEYLDANGLNTYNTSLINSLDDRYIKTCLGTASSGTSVSFDLGNSFRGVLVIQGTTSSSNGMYMVWTSGSGAVTSYDVRAASGVTFSNTTRKMTITAPSASGIHCKWYITVGHVSVATS